MKRLSLATITLGMFLTVTTLSTSSQDDQVIGNEPGCAQLRSQLQFPAIGPCQIDGWIMAPWGECVTVSQMQNTIAGIKALCKNDAAIDAWVDEMATYIRFFWNLCIYNPGLCYQIFRGN